MLSGIINNTIHIASSHNSPTPIIRGVMVAEIGVNAMKLREDEIKVVFPYLQKWLILHLNNGIEPISMATWTCNTVFNIMTRFKVTWSIVLVKKTNTDNYMYKFLAYLVHKGKRNANNEKEKWHHEICQSHTIPGRMTNEWRKKASIIDKDHKLQKEKMYSISSIDWEKRLLKRY